MAQGVAYAARLRGVPATIVVPEHAPQTKIDAIERYGGRVIKVPYEEWWQVLVSGRYQGAAGMFVHPVDNDRVMAGNGTIGLELLEQLADFDTVVVPYGGGGLMTGIASAVKAERPEVQIVVAEPETGAPVAATLAAGTPTAVEYTPSFVDGSGSRELIPRVWEQASQLLDGAFALPLDEVAAAVRLVAERARDRRGRRSALGCDRALEPTRRREEGRLHRLGRQHRPGRPQPHPRRGAALNVEALRERFSSLQKGFAFFDAPGGTQVPDEVGQAIANALREASGNLGAPYATGRAVEAILERAKGDAGRFLGCSPDEISFGMNMTTLDFAISRAAARDFDSGDEVLTTQLDHDGGVAPWVELAADKGLEVRVAAATHDLTVDYDDLERQLNERTRVVAFAIASKRGRLGVADAAHLRALAREAGAISWIDAVHYAAHEADRRRGTRLRRCCSARRTSSVGRTSASPTCGAVSPSGSARTRPVRRPRRRSATKFETGTLPYELLARLQRDHRLPRFDRRPPCDQRVQSAARRVPARQPARARDALRPAGDGGTRPDVPLQRRGRARG
jgi:hypothetical protein